MILKWWVQVWKNVQRKRTHKKKHNLTLGCFQEENFSFMYLHSNLCKQNNQYQATFHQRNLNLEYRKLASVPKKKIIFSSLPPRSWSIQTTTATTKKTLIMDSVYRNSKFPLDSWNRLWIMNACCLLYTFKYVLRLKVQYFQETINQKNLLFLIFSSSVHMIKQGKESGRFS